MYALERRFQQVHVRMCTWTSRASRPGPGPDPDASPNAKPNPDPKVYVDQPSVEATTAILRGLKERYEWHHGLSISTLTLTLALNPDVEPWP